jgi:hypothetical protein
LRGYFAFLLAFRSLTPAALVADSDSVNPGWAFGLNEALDQTGAMIGPLSVAAVLGICVGPTVFCSFGSIGAFRASLTP